MADQHANPLVIPSMPEPPEIPFPNVFPLEWPAEAPRIWELYERAKRETWNAADLDWAAWQAESLPPEHRLGILYWYTIDAAFENSGVAAFAQAAIRCYEDHTDDATKRAFVTVSRDECNHDEFCRRVCRRLSPGFPEQFRPSTPLERALHQNMQWIFYNGSRYWKAYAGGVRKYPLEALFCSFMTAELLGVLLYDAMSKKATIPIFQEAFRLFHRDETRHFALTQYLLDSAGPRLTDETRQVVTKQIRAGFELMSILFLEPIESFWEVPAGFMDVHRYLTDCAAESGIGALTFSERKQLCHNTMLRIKRLMDPHGIQFPALPEIDISGKETVIDKDEFLMVAL